MKVSVVGVGNVGGAVAFALVLKGIPTELVLVGRRPERLAGEAMDLKHASTAVRPMTVRAGGPDDTAGSGLVFICVSALVDMPESRLELAEPNDALLKEVIPPLAEASPEAVFVVITNPVDIATYGTLKASGLPPRQVIGTGTLLDTLRFRALIAEVSNINANDIRAYVLGEHGESQFPALSVASAGGVRLPQKDETLLGHFKRSSRSGMELAKMKGYTNYGVAMTAAMIAEAVEDDTNVVMPVSTFVEDFRGVSDVCLSLPCVIGRGGVRAVLPVDLDDSETQQLRESAAILRDILDQLGY